MCELAYTYGMQFSNAEHTLLEVWLQMVEPKAGDYVLGSQSRSPMRIHIDEKREVTRG